ncbi:MAG: SseB family protein, partial [Pseudomonadota bacterium]
ARIVEVAAPGALPERLLSALDAKLALMGAAARAALLAQVTFDTGAKSHLLAFIDPAPGAEPALSGAANEALTFSGLEAGQLDVTFLRASDDMAARMGKVALRFDLPDPVTLSAPSAPGSDPDKPPKLR